MCTLTWARLEDGYELFFNRDERRTRPLGLPPHERSSAGVRWVAPIDAEAGGTWLGVNERGLSVGLLNGYRAGDASDRDYESRGLLVARMLGGADTEAVRAGLSELDPRRFRSFVLVALEPGRDALRATWDLAELVVERVADGVLPFSSSSKDPGGAHEHRGRLFRARAAEHGGVAPGWLAPFHASHEPERGPWSVCMHREDASTVSRTRVRVSADEVVLGYRPGPPCEPAEETELRLARVHPRADAAR